MAKDERRKKTDCRRATNDYDVAASVVVRTDVRRRRRRRRRCRPSRRGSLARLALTVASSVGRLVCRMNECSWCQPRPITRYTTLTQCLLLLLLQWRRRRRGARASLPLAAAGKRRRGAAVNDTALSFFHMCLFTPASVGPLTERVAAS